MADWSKRKRLEAVIAGEKPDRLPVALWRHWPGDDQDADALAAASVKWQRDYDWDFLKVGPASSYSVIDWGGSDRWVGDIEGNRETVSYAVQTPDDWLKLTPLDPARGMLGRQVEALQRVGTAVAPTTPFIATVFSVLSQAKHLTGKERLLSHLRSHPDNLRHGLEAITESTLRFLEAARDAGIAGIYYAVQHARYPVLSSVEFDTWARPYDLRILEAASDLWLNVLHVHGSDIMLDAVADYPAHIVNWHDRETGVTLAEGLAQVGGAASGGVDHWTIHRESPEQALAEAADAVAQTGGRRLVLGTGCVLMVTTPTRNIRALREFVERV